MKDRSGHIAAGGFPGHPVTDEYFNTCMPESQKYTNYTNCLRLSQNQKLKKLKTPERIQCAAAHLLLMLEHKSLKLSLFKASFHQ